jgi:putative phosphoesterase
MQLLVMSDSHDNIWKLEAAAEHLARADVVLHCGDICSPFMVRRLGELTGAKPVHVIWGNNDGDTYLIGQVASGFPHVVLDGALAQFEIGGLKVAANHYPEISRGLAKSGDYGLVCYGHDHILHEERVGECLLLNPGELMGMKGRSTMAMIETADRSVDWLDL